MSESVNESWPTEIRLKDHGRNLTITFEGASPQTIPAELLRVESPSAEVKGHGPGQEQLVWGKRNVAITRLDPVGNYALRITFDDGHSTGLFTWTYLQKLARQQSELFAAYEAKLAEAGLRR